MQQLVTFPRWRVRGLLLPILLLQALLVAGTTPPDAGTIRKWIQQADSLTEISKVEAARNQYQRALQSARKLSPTDPVLLSKCLNSIGIFHYDHDEYAQCLLYFEEALALRIRTMDAEDERIANSFENLGNCQTELGQFEKAIANYEEAARRYARKAMPAEQASALSGAATCYWERSEFEQAFVLFAQIESIARELKDYKMLGLVQQNRGNIYYGLGKLHAAEKAQKAAIEYFELIEDSRAEYTSISHYNLSMVYSDLGMQDQAFHYLALDLAYLQSEEFPSADFIASNYNSQGILHYQLGDWAQAYAFFNSALHTARKTLGPDHLSLASYHHNLGNALAKQGEDSASLPAYREAERLILAHYGSNHVEMAGIYSNLGRTYFDLGGQDSLAFFYLREGVRCQLLAPPEERSVRDLANRLSNLGDAYLERDRYAEAAAQYRKMLDLDLFYRDQPMPERGDALQGLGECLVGMGRPLLALKFLDASQQVFCHGVPADSLAAVINSPISGSISSEVGLLETLRQKAQLLAQLAVPGSPDYLDRSFAALRTIDLATDLEFRIRQTYREAGPILELQAESRDLYETGLRRCADLLDAYPQNQALLDLAFALSEKNKASWLQQLIRESHTLQFAGVPATMRTRERELKAQIESYRELIFAAQDEGEDSAKISNLQARKHALKVEYAGLIQQIEKKNPAYFQLKYQRNLADFAELRRAYLTDHPETLFLEYFWGDSAVYLFFQFQEQVDLLRLELGDSTGAQVRELARTLSHLDDSLRPQAMLRNFQTSAYGLYQCLLAPALDRLPSGAVRQLLVVPDGPLHLLPLEVLLTADTPADESGFAGLPYLLRTYDVHYAFSGSLLLDVLRLRAGKPRDHEFPFYGFAPDFHLPEPAPATRPSPKGLPPLQNLPFSSSEVHDIASMLGGQAEVGNSASEGHFRAIAPLTRVLHLAAHAVLPDTRHRNPGILLQSGKSGEYDGILYSSELYNMELNADLAVLSACHTGAGDHFPGEGVMSLARAFYYSGCAAVVMSYWLSHDEATSQIMFLFYKRLAQGASKAEALRLAKLEYLDQADYLSGHPHFWAAFVLTGEGDPIPEYAPGSWARYWPWGLGVLLLLGGLALGAGRRRRGKATGSAN